MIFLAKGHCFLGYRRKDKDGNVVEESAARFETDPEGGSVAVGVLDDDTMKPTAPKDDESERHLCPLQIPIIERCLRMYTNPGDVVFTPFLGIGSEVYTAIKMGRKGIGIELKPAYFDAAVENIKNAEMEMQQQTIFNM